jgi:prolyl oligopeptidase
MPLSTFSYPAIEDTLHGVSVSDPYRWLEDRSLPGTEQWIEAQRNTCETYFANCTELGSLRRRVCDFLNVEIVDQPARTGDLYFYRRRKKDQDQASIYLRDGATNEERLLVDPSEQGLFASVGIYRISDDATLLAYQLRHGGSDAVELRILDVRSGRILPDHIGSGYARGISFASDNSGFYYCHELESGSGDSLIEFHSFSDPFKDRTVFTRPRSQGNRLVLIADGIHIGAVWIHEHKDEAVCDFYIAPRTCDGDWRTVFENKRLPHSPLLHDGKVFALSYEDAPNGKLIEFTLDGNGVQTILPESDTHPRQIVVAGGRFFVRFADNGDPSIRSWTPDGIYAGEIHSLAEGTIQLLPCLGPSSNSLFYTFESFVQPPQLYEYATESARTSLFSLRNVSSGQSDVQVRAVSCTGTDGTVIPVTLVGRKEVPSQRTRPVIMTSYGGFGASMTPQFSVLVTIMMELGATFAIPHIRGGGEFGQSWHDAARTINRQTAIDDFVAAGEWLCAEGITTSAQLAILGGSNSGLLVAAAMTQRPNLFGAVLCIAPLLDMVRYERFDRAAAWRSEYGSVDKLEDFHALLSYSPYHRVRPDADYPATLFVSGDRDDRCNPAHVRKMAARLQNRAAQRNPVLVDYSPQRGHSPALPLAIRIEALARRIAFLCREMGIEIPKEASAYAPPA